ncbi:MAG: uracil-DNA glycosylase, partial [Gallionella sp.]|nr:uracil-DNA glycosylase [Gallionella sp.]
MDRNEAVLRELNLYPQWVRRDVPEQTSATTTVGAIHESPEQAGATNNVGAIHESPAQTGYHELPLHWPELKQQVRDCTACKLRAGCTQTV